MGNVTSSTVVTVNGAKVGWSRPPTVTFAGVCSAVGTTSATRLRRGATRESARTSAEACGDTRASSACACGPASTSAPSCQNSTSQPSCGPPRTCPSGPRRTTPKRITGAVDSDFGHTSSAKSEKSDTPPERGRAANTTVPAYSSHIALRNASRSDSRTPSTHAVRDTPGTTK